MDAQETWGSSRLDREPGTIISWLQRSGIYIFLISFACVYYLSNAPLMLGHYDLGWHLAAGDLIRDQGNIPGSMVFHVRRQAMVQPLLALGRARQRVV